MESELIRLMQEGMSLKDYDEEWFDNFFEIYASSVPLTADEQDVLAQLLAHGYLKEWETDYNEKVLPLDDDIKVYSGHDLSFFLLKDWKTQWDTLKQYVED